MCAIVMHAEGRSGYASEDLVTQYKCETAAEIHNAQMIIELKTFTSNRLL